MYLNETIPEVIKNHLKGAEVPSPPSVDFTITGTMVWSIPQGTPKVDVKTLAETARQKTKLSQIAALARSILEKAKF